MAIGRKVVWWTVAVLTALVLLAAWQQFRLSRSLSTVSAQPFETIFKKAVSDVVVAKQRNSSSQQANLPRGYLIAYEQNPEGFKADTKLFDTWFTAGQLAISVLEHGSSEAWVKNSSTLDFVRSEYKVDPWGHSLCLMRRDDAVLVISGGPGAPGSPVCKDVGMTVEDLRKFPKGKLLQSPSGSLVLVAFKTSQPVRSTD